MSEPLAVALGTILLLAVAGFVFVMLAGKPLPSSGVEGACSRCKQGIKDFRPPEGGMTAGYYHVHSLDDGCWGKFANPGERYICDACMWSDPRYIALYGTHHNPRSPSSLPVPETPSDRND